MEHLSKMIELADMEFGSVAKNGKFRSREEIDSVYKLMDIVKDAMCIEDMLEGGYDEGSYAYEGRSMRDGRGGSYRGSSYEGGSYARGRGGNARRDSMGRYSRDGGSYRYDGYSRGGDKQEYIENLREMMNSTQDEQTRMKFQDMIRQMEQG